MKTIAKVFLLFSTGVFLASRLWNGSLSFYIHPRFNSLTALTAVGLIIIAVAYGLYQWRQGDTQAVSAAMNRERELSWLGLMLLGIPILLGAFVTPRPLGASAFSNREVNVNTLTLAPGAGRVRTIPTSGERNIMDWIYAFQRAAEPTEFNGEEARLIGFVYRDERFDADMFMVSRFTVSCCVADAAPVGLVVQWDETPALLDDEWVEVNGRFEARSFNGILMPILVAESVQKTDAPAQPYLYQ